MNPSVVLGKRTADQSRLENLERAREAKRLKSLHNTNQNTIEPSLKGDEEPSYMDIPEDVRDRHKMKDPDVWRIINKFKKEIDKQRIIRKYQNKSYERSYEATHEEPTSTFPNMLQLLSGFSVCLAAAAIRTGWTMAQNARATPPAPKYNYMADNQNLYI